VVLRYDGLQGYVQTAYRRLSRGATIKEEADMDYGRVLKRAWDTVWRYKALWIFGAILALTAGGGSGANFYGSRGEDFGWQREWRLPDIPPNVRGVLIGFAIALAVELVVLVVIASIARYVAETSLIGMVDEYEETGEKRRVGQGFRLGWSRTAWRLFLIDLLVGLPTAVAFLLLFALVAAPALLWLTGSTVAGALGTAVTVILFFPALLLVIVVGTLLAVLMRFFRRACVIEGLGVTASLRRGYRVAKQRWGKVAVMWLIMLGIGLGWVVASMVLFIVLVPLFILLALAGIVVGGLPALLAYWVAELASAGPGRWVPYIAAAGVGIGFGLPVFVVVAGAPWLFVSGLMEVFKSSVWTQTYRELRARDQAEGTRTPEPEASDEGE
jgi:hypothetical protein